VHLLSDGSELPLVDSWTVVGGRSRAMVSFGPQPEWTYPLPDRVDTVLEIELR
jgi:alpha-L-fucosidase